jgi:hypothetical protein
MTKTKNKLDLKLRAARIGPSLNNFREKHGDENVPRSAIRILEIELSRKEIDKLIDRYSNGHFDGEGDEAVPAYPQLAATKYTETFEGAVVRLVPGVDRSHKGVELKDCRLKSITLEPRAGGVTRMNLTVICDPPSNLLRILDSLDSVCFIEISGATMAERAAKDAQGDLSLGSPPLDGEDDQPRAH